MAKLARAGQRVFAQDSGVNEVEQIGSLRNGAPNYTKDPVVLQALSQYLDGLLACVTVDKYIPAIEDINAIYFLFSRQLGYLFQEGIAEYDATTEYHIGSLAKDVATPNVYRSIANTNTGNALSDTTKWLPYNTEGQIPLGGYQAVAIGIAGAASDANMIAAGFAKCDGTTPASQSVVSPAITATMPNINAGAFIRGNTVAWTTGGASGGADTINIQHSHTVDSHTHDVNITSFTSGAGSAHAHAVGTLQFKTVDRDFDGTVQAYNISGADFNLFNAIQRGTGSEPETAILAGGTANQGYTKDGTGSVANEASHTHPIDPPNTTSTGTSPGTNNQLSTTQSILPTYFSAVYYMRVR